MQKLYAASFAALVVLVSGAVSLAVATFFQAREFSVAIPQGPAVFETSLQSRISSSDTSMTLVANSVRGGSSLSGYQCFTIDEGRSDMEYVCGTISGTTVASLERGVDPLTATSTNSNLRFAHRVGANVKVTDFPLLQRLRHFASGSEAFPGPLYLHISTSTLAALSSSTIATTGYVNHVGSSGCSDSSSTVRGCVEAATAAEVAAGTSAGETGALLFAPNSLATSTPSAGGCPIACLAVATAGKLSQRFFNLTEHWIFSSLFATNASSTNATTTSQYVSGPARFDGSVIFAGTVQGAAGRLIYSTSTDATVSATGYATSSSFTIPGGFVTASSTIETNIAVTCANNGSSTGDCLVYLRLSDGTDIASTTIAMTDSTSGTAHGSMRVLTYSNNSVTSQFNQVLPAFIEDANTDVYSFTTSQNYSSINTASNVSLVFVIRTTDNNLTATLKDASIVVTK